MSFKITWKTHVLCTVISSLLGIALYKTLNKVVLRYANEVVLFIPFDYIMLSLYMVLIVIVVINSIVHELLHGIAFKIFGCKVTYGFKGIYAYAKETTGKPLERTKFLIVLLMPVTVISLMSIFIGGWLGGLIYILNLLGSTGDFLMAFYLCKFNSGVMIIDKSHGFDVV